MKKFRLFKALSIFAIAAAGAVAIGVGTSSPKAEAAEAADTDFIYLDNSNFYEGNERYAAYFFTDGVGSEWVNFTWDASIGYNKVQMKSYQKVILCRMNGASSDNNWSNRWNQTADLDNHTGIFKPYSKSGTNVGGSWRYPLSVGNTKTFMIPNGTAEVKATINASANDAVSLKEDEDSSVGTLYPQLKASNNMTSDKKIKISGSATIYVAKSGWSTWVSGYAPSSTKLQDFCDALLALDCSATDYTSCGWSGLNTQEKADFNNANVMLGDNVTYVDFGNVVNEAATRYARLLNNPGAKPLEGVTVASASYFGVMTLFNDSTSSTVLIVVVSLVAISAGAGFYFIRKRKHI